MSGLVTAGSERPTSSRLGRWLARESARQSRTVVLEEALLARRTGCYAWYRLRFFLAGYLVESAAHALLAGTLFATLDAADATLVVGVHAGALLLSHAWWGACEGLRGEVRALFRAGRAHRVPEVIAAWMTLAGAVSVGALAAGAAWILTRLATGTVGDGGVVNALVVITILRLALEVPARTLHAGVYATRRVYVPIGAVAAPHVLSAAVLLSGMPGALITSALVTALLGPALSVRYTAKVYAFTAVALGTVLTPVPQRQAWRRILPARSEAFGGAVGYAATGLDGIVVLALLGGGAQAVYLVLPTLTAAAGWARLPYFDLKRLELRLFANLRRRFERDTDRLAVLLGVVLGGIAAAVTLLNGGSLAVACALVVLLTARSVLACTQVQAFAGRAYAALGSTGVTCAVASAVVGAVVPGEPARIAALAAVTATTAALLHVVLARRGRPAVALLTLEWLRALGATRRPVRVGAARLALPTGRATADAARWQLETVAARVARRVGRSGAAAWLPPDRLLWASTGDDPNSDPVSAAWLQEVTGGLVDRVHVTGHPDGEAALLAVARSGLLGRPGAVLQRAVLPVDLAAIRRAFHRLVPTGVVVAPDEPLPAPVGALTGRQLAAVLADATDYARALAVPRRRAHIDVTSLCIGGELRLLFLGSSRRWHTELRSLNLRAAIAGSTGDPIGAALVDALGTEPNTERAPGARDAGSGAAVPDHRA